MESVYSPAQKAFAWPEKLSMSVFLIRYRNLAKNIIFFLIFRACETDEASVVDGAGAGQRLLHQLFRLCLRCRTPGMCAYLWSYFILQQAPEKFQ